jgi:hypothetical protein
MGRERRVIHCLTRGEIVDAETALFERKRAIERRWVASTGDSRSPVDGKPRGIYVLVDGERQASSDGGANPTSRDSDGSRPR